jgi:hypothetical protein
MPISEFTEVEQGKDYMPEDFAAIDSADFRC